MPRLLHFARRLWHGLLACLAILTMGSADAADRPNIVLIFADDLGWQEPGFAGSDYCQTPNLDRLASDGMVFRQAYAAAGNCAPSRACMLSGQYPPGTASMRLAAPNAARSS